MVFEMSASFSCPLPGDGSNACADAIETVLLELVLLELDAVPLWLPLTKTPATINAAATRMMTTVGTSQPRSVLTKAGGGAPAGVLSRTETVGNTAAVASAPL